MGAVRATVDPVAPVREGGDPWHHGGPAGGDRCASADLERTMLLLSDLPGLR